MTSALGLTMEDTSNTQSYVTIVVFLKKNTFIYVKLLQSEGEIERDKERDFIHWVIPMATTVAKAVSLKPGATVSFRSPMWVARAWTLMPSSSASLRPLAESTCHPHGICWHCRSRLCLSLEKLSHEPFLHPFFQFPSLLSPLMQHIHCVIRKGVDFWFFICFSKTKTTENRSLLEFHLLCCLWVQNPQEAPIKRVYCQNIISAEWMQGRLPFPQWKPWGTAAMLKRRGHWIECWEAALAVQALFTSACLFCGNFGMEPPEKQSSDFWLQESVDVLVFRIVVH